MRPSPGDNVFSFLLRQVQSERGKGRRYLPEIHTRVKRQMEIEQPINFAVIAIAHKNPNRDICGGRTSPEISELGFLLHLVDIIDGVEAVYPPGARFTILTEGEFYRANANIFDVSKEEIHQYEEVTQYISNRVSNGRVRFFSLQDIVGSSSVFQEKFIYSRHKLNENDYLPYISVMQRSVTERQKCLGITPEKMAKDYVALHKAKHLAGENGGSLIYQFLENTLGSNYVYCSVTGSKRDEVLNIDPMKKSSIMPQHGIGILEGGTSRIKIVPFIELQEFVKHTQVASVVSGDIDSSSFGFINFGKRR